MIRNYLSFTLVTFLIFEVCFQSVFALPGTGDEIEEVKAQVLKRGTGENAKVVVKMKDGTKLTGYISQILDDSFDLTDGKTKQITTIHYRDVAGLKKQGMSKGTKIALGVGIGVVVTAVIVGRSAKKGLSGFCPLGCGPF